MILFTIAGIMAYIWFRFEWQFGIAAVATLVHDAILTVGFFALTLLGPTAPLAALGVCLAVIGSGTGMIFPTLTLSYQSAVEFHELGVATQCGNCESCARGDIWLGCSLDVSVIVLPPHRAPRL